MSAPCFIGSCFIRRTEASRRRLTPARIDPDAWLSFGARDHRSSVTLQRPLAKTVVPAERAVALVTDDVLLRL